MSCRLVNVSSCGPVVEVHTTNWCFLILPYALWWPRTTWGPAKHVNNFCTTAAWQYDFIRKTLQIAHLCSIGATLCCSVFRFCSWLNELNFLHPFFPFTNCDSIFDICTGWNLQTSPTARKLQTGAVTDWEWWWKMDVDFLKSSFDLVWISNQNLSCNL